MAGERETPSVLWDILVVARNPAVAAVIDLLFSGDPRFRIFGVVPTAEQALVVSQQSGENVDLIVVDDRLSGPTSGVPVAPELRRLFPRAQVILFGATAGQDDATVDATVDQATPRALVPTAQRLLGLAPFDPWAAAGHVALPAHRLGGEPPPRIMDVTKPGGVASRPFIDFTDAGEAVLQHLSERLGLGLWMLLEREGDAVKVVGVRGADAYGLELGDGFDCSQPFWSDLVSDRWRAVSEAGPTHVETTTGHRLAVGAYVAAVLTRPDGEAFGALCGLDPRPQPQLVSEGPLVSFLAVTLSTLYAREHTIVDQARRLEEAEANAFLDPLTGLYNRRGWERLLEAEEQRCRRFDIPAAIVYIDLDDLKTVNDTAGHAAGDAYLRRTGDALRSVMRRHDVAARLGGDEFAVLAVSCTAQGGAVLVRRLKEAFRHNGVGASVGMAARESGGTLEEACRAADAAMYEEKLRAS